jgi:hypothetical protein
MSPLLKALVGIVVSVCASAQTLTIYLGNAAAQPPAVLQQMRQETARLLEPAGIRLEWRSLETRKVDDEAERLMVVRLQGTCNYRRGALPMGGTPLASTHTSGDSILPFTDVKCEALSAMVSAQATVDASGRKEQVMGRAMGRVIAHEIYHVIGQVRHHAGAGVAKACFQFRDLVDDRFTFDAETVALLRRDKPAASSSGEEVESDGVIAAGR